MPGFFSKKETQSVSMVGGKINSCFSCGLFANCNSPKMKPFGEFKSNVLIISSNPSIEDDKNKQSWSDEVGHYLKITLAKIGHTLFRDDITTYAVKCHSKNDHSKKIEVCRRFVMHTIKETQPKLILLFGVEAVQSVIGHRFSKDIGSIEKWRGFCIPDQELKAWICPVYHPKQVFEKKELENLWMTDLRKALSFLKTPFRKYKSPVIDYIEDLSPLSNIKSDFISFDYETTGLKPHAKGHRIICASVADTEDHVFAFMMPETKSERQPFIDLLKRHSLGKMAHNMKYEHSWTYNKLKTEIINWEWDSMIAAHIIDNREGVTGLKFQTYINFGVIDYSSEISPYLDGVDKGGNSLNTIHKLIETEQGKHKLLTYCAMDSVYQYRLAMLQMKILNYQFLPF